MDARLKTSGISISKPKQGFEITEDGKWICHNILNEQPGLTFMEQLEFAANQIKRDVAEIYNHHLFRR